MNIMCTKRVFRFNPLFVVFLLLINTFLICITYNFERTGFSLIQYEILEILKKITKHIACMALFDSIQVPENRL